MLCDLSIFVMASADQLPWSTTICVSPRFTICSNSCRFSNIGFSGLLMSSLLSRAPLYTFISRAIRMEDRARAAKCYFTDSEAVPRYILLGMSSKDIPVPHQEKICMINEENQYIWNLIAMMKIWTSKLELRTHTGTWQWVFSASSLACQSSSAGWHRFGWAASQGHSTSTRMVDTRNLEHIILYTKRNEQIFISVYSLNPRILG